MWHNREKWDYSVNVVGENEGRVGWVVVVSESDKGAQKSQL